MGERDSGGPRMQVRWIDEPAHAAQRGSASAAPRYPQVDSFPRHQPAGSKLDSRPLGPLLDGFRAFPVWEGGQESGRGTQSTIATIERDQTQKVDAAA